MRGRADFHIGQSDLRPYLRKQLVLEETGDPIPIEAGDVVDFRMSNFAYGGDKMVTGQCIIVNLASSVVEYQWSGTDTEVAGRFDAEFVIQYSDGGSPFTVPNYDDKMLVKVVPSVI